MENSRMLRLPELCDPPKITQLGCGKARIPIKVYVNSGSVIFPASVLPLCILSLKWLQRIIRKCHFYSKKIISDELKFMSKIFIKALFTML